MQDSNSIRPLPYMRSLDGLRGIAVIAVMICHANHVLGQGGLIGVDIFFGLSGFLITSLLLQEWEQNRTINLRRFYLRRALRLFPALFVLAACAVIYALFFLAAEKRAVLLLATATSVGYVSNWFSAFGWLKMSGLGLGHTWTLSVEEQFYLVWPILLSGLLKLRSRPWYVIAILTAAVVGVAIERSVLLRHGATYNRIYVGSDTRADSILMGAVAGVVATWQLVNPNIPAVRVLLSLWTTVSVMVVAGMLLVWKWPTGQPFTFLIAEGGFTLIAVSVAGILLWLRAIPDTRLQRFLEIPPLVWIGRISYGLYLWHWFIYSIVEDHLPRGGWKVIVGEKIGLSFAAALLSYVYVETPFLRWKKRISPQATRHSEPPLIALAD